MCWISAGCLACSLTCALLVAFALRSGRLRRPAFGTVLIGAMALFWAPQIGAPRHMVLDESGLNFLQHHARLSRYYSLGPLSSQRAPSRTPTLKAAPVASNTEAHPNQPPMNPQSRP